MPTFIPEGHGLIPGRGSENAGKVLRAAEQAGVSPSLVRTVDDGYLAPLAVLDAYEAANRPAPKKTEKEPEPSPKPAAKRSAARKKE